MRSDMLHADSEAALRRVLRHLESSAPIPPDLPATLMLPPDPSRQWSPARVLVTTFFLIIVVVAAPVGLLLRSDDGSPNVGSETETSISTTASAPDSVPAITTAGTIRSTLPAEPPPNVVPNVLPELGPMEQITTPLPGVEGFSLAASDDGLFAADSVPNPDDWDNRVWRSTDGGDSWHEVLAVLGDGILVDIAATDVEIDVLLSGHVVEGPSFVYRSVDGGDSWQRIEVPLPEGATGMTTTSVAIGSSTLVTGWSWQEVRNDSFDGGQVLVSTPVGLVVQAWALEVDAFGPAFVVAPDGHVSDLVWDGDRFTAVGRTSADPGHPAVWTSADGEIWTVIAIPDPPDGCCTGVESVSLNGNGTLIAIAEARGDWHDTAVYRRTETAEWQVARIRGFEFVAAIGTDWGFVAGAVQTESGQLAVVASLDGVEWSVIETIDAYVSGGVAIMDHIYMVGQTSDGDGAAIWVVETS